MEYFSLLKVAHLWPIKISYMKIFVVVSFVFIFFSPTNLLSKSIENNAEKFFIITGKVDSSFYGFGPMGRQEVHIDDGDTLFLAVLNNDPISDFINLGHTLTISSIVKDGRFQFRVPIEGKVTFFSVGLSNRLTVKFLDNYMAQPGDEVFVYFNNERYKFSSKSASTFLTQFDIKEKYREALYTNTEDTTNFNSKTEVDKLIDRGKYLLHSRDVLIEYLDGRDGADTSTVIQVLKYQIIGDVQLRLIQSLIGLSIANEINNQNTPTVLKFMNGFLDMPSTDLELVYTSANYLKYLVLKQHILHSLKHDTQNTVTEIINLYSGRFRDYLLTYLVYVYSNANLPFKYSYDTALPYVFDPSHIRFLEGIAKGKSVDIMAPDFSLTNTQGEKVNLSDFRGKVVFLDFWFTGCGPCQLYYKGTLHDVEKRYVQNPKIVFLTVSIDKDFNLWRASVASGKYTSESVINLYTEGKGNKHSVISDYYVTNYPKPILISKAGKILFNDAKSLGALSDNNKSALIQSIEMALVN